MSRKQYRQFLEEVPKRTYTHARTHTHHTKHPVPQSHGTTREDRPPHTRTGEKKNDVNGQAYVLQEGAKQLAHYPHMREVNGMLYVSGLSSRCALLCRCGVRCVSVFVWFVFARVYVCFVF